MDLLSLLGAFALVIANGFFVAVEFALVKVRPTALESMVTQGESGAATALAMRKNLDVWLSACQVGITLASLALGWIGEPAFAKLVEPLILAIAPETDSARAISHTIGVIFAFVTISFLHIVVGEQVPKTLAIARSEKTAIALAWPMKAFYFLFFPVIWLLNAGTRAVLKLFGLSGKSNEHGEALGEDELRMIFASSAEAGALAEPRAELLQRALSMMEKTARQVLVPRSQMHTLDIELPLKDNVDRAYRLGHTWLLVIRNSLDRVEGLVNVKDLLYLESRGELKSLEQVQRPVLFVPENITLEQLLAEFKRRNKQIAVVVDEHGGTSGLVTISDVVAELVGKVADLGRKSSMQTLPGGKLELPGTAQLDDLEHTLEVEFDVDKTQITTIAGFLMAKLGRVPNQNDVWVLSNFRIVVVKIDGPRVITVRFEPATPVARTISSEKIPVTRN
jgi:CBS domain containing-hemolysin-like protein